MKHQLAYLIAQEKGDKPTMRAIERLNKECYAPTLAGDQQRKKDELRARLGMMYDNNHGPFLEDGEGVLKR